VRFGIYSSVWLTWTYYQLFPVSSDVPAMSFSREDKDDMKYYY
jgi:hypothetical protein